MAEALRLRDEGVFPAQVAASIQIFGFEFN